MDWPRAIVDEYKLLVRMAIVDPIRRGPF